MPGGRAAACPGAVRCGASMSLRAARSPSALRAFVGAVGLRGGYKGLGTAQKVCNMV